MSDEVSSIEISIELPTDFAINACTDAVFEDGHRPVVCLARAAARKHFPSTLEDIATVACYRLPLGERDDLTDNGRAKLITRKQSGRDVRIAPVTDARRSAA